MIAGVVLAAGGSSRFGSPKQLAELRGRPLLDYVLDAVRAVPAVDPILVVLGANAERVRAAVELDDVEAVVRRRAGSRGSRPRCERGSSAPAMPTRSLVVLGDQPLITPQVIAAVARARRRRPRRPHGRPSAGRPATRC